MADVLASDELVEEPSDYGALQPGTRLGRYELLVPIARGGMARVWAARLHGQRGFQKLVAIKVILPHLAEEAEFERMFLDEARIASGVHHPNVCEIYELGEEDKTLYLVMEWVSGDSLARVLRASGKTEPLDPRVVGRVIADACAGVHAAHELTDDDGRSLGVVHRDLSPHNILLTADGTAKVCDFGVAKALGQLHEATSAGQLKGKIAYMAPEQITGAIVDRRSDVFSLGCVLYEATTGTRPFRGDGDHQVMHAVLKGDLPPPTSLLRGYPAELERIVMRALSPQPILRFPTAERMRFALEEYVARGQLVTQTNVAQVLRARIGGLIDRRKERIRQASTAGDGESGWSEPPGNMTPSNQAHGGHRSGVMASNSMGVGQQGSRPLYSTLLMDRPQAAEALARLAADAASPNAAPAGAKMGALHPTSSTTLPHASPYPQGLGHTPASHPGASYPSTPPPALSGTPPPVGAPAGPGPSGAPAGPGPSGAPAGPGPSGASAGPGPSGASAGPGPSGASAGPGPSGAPFGQQTALMSPPTLPPGYATSSSPPGSPGPFAPPAAFGAPPDDDATNPDPPSSAAAGVAGHYLVAVGVGILLAAMIGVAGFYFWQRQASPSPSPRAPATIASGPASGPAAGSRAGSVGAPVSPDITFRMTPADAMLSVEGQELAETVRAVPRPAIGKTVNIVVRAKGHEDATILIDFFTTSPVDLKLKPLEANTAAAAGAAAPEAAKDPPKDPPREPTKRAPRQAKDPGVPANPY